MAIQGRDWPSGTSDIEVSTGAKLVRNVSVYAPDEDIVMVAGAGAAFTVPAGMTFTATDINPLTNIKITRASATAVYLFWW